MHVKRVNHNPSNPVSMPSTVIPLLSVRQRAFMAMSSNHNASGVTAASRFYISNGYWLTWHVFCLIKCLFLVLWLDRRGFTQMTRALGATTPQCWTHAEERRSVYLSYLSYPLPHWCYSSLWSPGERNRDRPRTYKTNETWDMKENVY